MSERKILNNMKEVDRAMDRGIDAGLSVVSILDVDDAITYIKATIAKKNRTDYTKFASSYNTTSSSIYTRRVDGRFAVAKYLFKLDSIGRECDDALKSMVRKSDISNLQKIFGIDEDEAIIICEDLRKSNAFKIFTD